jgi:sulfur relay protein TusB/DsrH
MLLHTVSASPYFSTRFADAVAASVAGDSVLLVGDAIFAAVNNSEFATAISDGSQITWYVIDEDCQIRGIDTATLHPSAIPIGYEKFVELTIAADSTIAW